MVFDLGKLLMAVLGIVSVLLAPPRDVAEQKKAVLEDDYVTYAALNGMRLRYYNVVTSDGWILQLWRIQSPEIFDEKLSAPVIVSHGFGSSSFTFMLNLRNESIAFVLADNGFDVWLGNFRANQYSNKKMRGGKPAKPKPSDYYRTGWQQMADYDFPAMIDFVLNETKQSKLYVTGNSMGATIPFAFLSGNHSYDAEIAHFAAVVPVLRFGSGTSPTLKRSFSLAPFLTQHLPQPFFEYTYGRQFLPSTGSDASMLSTFLEAEVCTIVSPLCISLDSKSLEGSLFTTLATNSHLNSTRAGIYFARGTGGSTMMSSYNFATEFGNDTWSKIDYNKLPQTNITNQEEYNQEEPPVYNFADIRVSFSMFYVYNDIYTDRKTAEAVIVSINATDVKFIDGDGLSHSDTSQASDVRCYTVNDFVSKFSDIEAGRGKDREDYRRKVAAFVKNLPFEDGCINKSS